MHQLFSNPDSCPFARYIRESGEVEIVPCSSTDAVHMETLRLRVNYWLGRADQLGAGFFYKMVRDVSVYFGLAVIHQQRRKLVLGLRYTDGLFSSAKAPKSIDWKTRLKNARNDLAKRYAVNIRSPEFAIPYPDHTVNGYIGWNGRRLRMLLDNERRLCWHQRIAEASEQLEFTPLRESEDDVYKCLSSHPESDAELLYKLAREGQLFTSLASKLGLSSGAWILACDQYSNFNALDMDLYMTAIEPQVNAWAEDVLAARRELSAAYQKFQ